MFFLQEHTFFIEEKKTEEYSAFLMFFIAAVCN